MEDKKRTDGVRIPSISGPLSRREFLRLAGIAGVGVGLGGALAGCGDSTTTTTAGSATTVGATTATTAGASMGREIKIGFVTPLTGPIAGFGEADTFCIDEWAAAAPTVDIGGTTHPIKVIVADSQSDPGRAGQVAGDLINNDKIDLMLVASTPDTVNPVADQCEANGIPCISNDTPWQPFFFGRGGDPAVGFNWTYHFFWGLEDVIANFTAMWNAVGAKKVGAMWPNDPDGNAWADVVNGFPPALTAGGFELVDPGRFQALTEDFSAQISKFKEAGCEIATGVMIPPDFANFWQQSAQQGFKPKIASVGKGLLFPSSMEALGDIGYGLTTEVWWTPNHPFTSSLTGESCGDLAAKYESKTGKQWTQPLLHYAVYEVAMDALSRTADIDDKASIVDAIKTTKMDTIAGPVDWSTGPVPNVSKTPLVGGQWVKGEKYPYDLKIVSNVTAPEIALTGEVQPL
ncbi:MAG: ABC transporter substrate-binding protein [Actinobacteria bacterium]|nr:ABC transporter substrate-binding protein [Actinomycetota bacterium]